VALVALVVLCRNAPPRWPTPRARRAAGDVQQQHAARAPARQHHRQPLRGARAALPPGPAHAAQGARGRQGARPRLRPPPASPLLPLHPASACPPPLPVCARRAHPPPPPLPPL
jgi:hypothetical protein